MTWNTQQIAGFSLSAVLTTAGAVAPAQAISPKEIKLRPDVGFEQTLKDVWDNLKPNIEEGDYLNESILDIGDIVKAVKSGLGLPDKDIAEIFHVSRQTIHTYRTQEPSSINLKEQTLDRANRIYEIIGEINKIFDKSPGPAAKNIQINQTSLFDLLCKEDADIEKILNVSYLLEDKIQKDRQILHAKRDSDSERKRTLHSLTKHT